MDMNIVSESYKASSLNRNAENAAITELTVMQNSTAAFQVILHDNKTKWVNVGTSYRFGPDLATPIYRIQVESQLNVNLTDYYLDDHGIAYADKIIEDEFISYPGSLDAPILITIPTTNLAVGERSLNVKVYQGLPGQAETLIDDRQLVVHVIANPLEATTPRLHVDIWQQPANLAKQFKVGLWSDAQHDINYNPNFFPVGDMGLAYPLKNGRLGGSLRLLALMRACEDYALLMRVDSATRQVALASLFNNHDIASWMVDERTTADGIFSSDDDAFTKFRNILLAK